jgi:hypothetical protein
MERGEMSAVNGLESPVRLKEKYFPVENPIRAQNHCPFDRDISRDRRKKRFLFRRELRRSRLRFSAVIVKENSSKSNICPKSERQYGFFDVRWIIIR